jgi:hypothetical protein
MCFLSRLFFSALAGLAASAGPAAATQGDDALVELCRGELADRLTGGTGHGETFVIAKDVQHETERVSVRLELASGEGRRITGNCVFRNGRLFDIKQ